jgi:hypothetical protein
MIFCPFIQVSIYFLLFLYLRGWENQNSFVI